VHSSKEEGNNFAVDYHVALAARNASDKSDVMR
jgi:hypothetical protein